MYTVIIIMIFVPYYGSRVEIIEVENVHNKEIETYGKN